MKTYMTIILVLLVMTQVVIPAYAQGTYSVTIGDRIEWRIRDCPDVPFQWGWGSGITWSTSNGSVITFTISGIHQDDIDGIFTIGNLTIPANNSMIAMELVLGVWGIIPWFPGLIICIDDLESITENAIASAERIYGNYLNGTMDIISGIFIDTINGRTYSAMIFNYTQDDTGFGEPQQTLLVYDVLTGILLRARTSYSFGVPYVLDMMFFSVTNGTHITYAVLILSAVSMMSVGVILWRRR